MKYKVLVLQIITLGIAINGFAQTESKPERKNFVSTSVWMLANFAEDPPEFYEFNYGIRPNSRDEIIFNFTTWTYPEPLGIPLGNDKKYSGDEEYPGYIRAFGVGGAYQRFIWKKLYLSGHANTFLQNFMDEDDKKIQSGFQLYLQARVGYRFDFFDGKLFLKPAINGVYWPINSNFPDEFKQVEEGWPNYFLFEPHLNIGFSF